MTRKILNMRCGMGLMHDRSRHPHPYAGNLHRNLPSFTFILA